MRNGRDARLVCGVINIAAIAMGLAAATARGGAEDAPAQRGEIVIKPTGRKVRVVSAAGAATARVQPADVQVSGQVSTQASAQVSARPAVLSLTPTTAPRVWRASFEQGLDFGEQSVRLPYGSDPRDNAYYGAGPVVHFPYYDYYSTPWYGGFGYGRGYGSRFGYANYGRNYGLGSVGHSRRSGAWMTRVR
jgi:hypothetical protein